MRFRSMRFTRCRLPVFYARQNTVLSVWTGRSLVGLNLVAYVRWGLNEIGVPSKLAS